MTLFIVRTGDGLKHVRKEDIRPVSKADFVRCTRGTRITYRSETTVTSCFLQLTPFPLAGAVVRASVSKASLQAFEDWNGEYGCTG